MRNKWPEKDSKKKSLFEEKSVQQDCCMAWGSMTAYNMRMDLSPWQAHPSPTQSKWDLLTCRVARKLQKKIERTDEAKGRD